MRGLGKLHDNHAADIISVLGFARRIIRPEPNRGSAGQTYVVFVLDGRGSLLQLIRYFRLYCIGVRMSWDQSGKQRAARAVLKNRRLCLLWGGPGDVNY